MLTSKPHACLAATLCWLAVLLIDVSAWAAATSPASTNAVVILAIEGQKEQSQISRSGSDVWDPAYPGQVLRPGDRGRTGPSSRMTIRFSDLSVMRIAERGSFTIQAPPNPDQTHSVSLWKGLLYLFHRDKPGSTRINSQSASAATRGTEFTVEVDETGQTLLLSVLAGEGELSNSQGTLIVKPGEQGNATLGRQPFLSPRIDTRRIIQWVLHYPMVLSPQDLQLSESSRQRLSSSLAAYALGDLSGAVTKLPASLPMPEPSEALYRAALDVALGQIQSAETALMSLVGSNGSEAGLAQSILSFLSAIRAGREESGGKLQTSDARATEAMAGSYVAQSKSDIEGALAQAERATVVDPAFGAAWARMAELLFGLGRARDAQGAVERALELSPSNASARALQGFLRAQRGNLRMAANDFDEAIRLDGGLSTGWLGRGLVKIRRGDIGAGREDLQIAASMEPQRGVLRSWLAKAWHEQGEAAHARKELQLARELDPADPTALFYSALLNMDHNRFNQAVRDFEESKRLNDNRAVYRSRLLLDQDKAVRGANLAGAYEETGLREPALSEATRAVASDYAQYSSHLFLANVYNSLRDPHQINLRYETPWLSEYLVANLLAPAGAGTVSQAVSQQEYTRFFERTGLGFVSSTEYQSRGDWVQSAAQYGRFARMSYALEGSYRSEKGQRLNEELTSRFLNVQYKQEVGARDSLYLQAIEFDSESGDLTPYHDPSRGTPGFEARERSNPAVIAGWHREWSPGSHTLFLAGRLAQSTRVRNPQFQSFTLAPAGPSVTALATEVDAVFASDWEIYTAEIQHILERGSHTWVGGVRGQIGEIESKSEFLGLATVNGFIIQPTPGPSSQGGSDFSRLTAYLYDHWQVGRSLLLVAGVSIDHLTAPANHRFAPLSAGEESVTQVNPKLGMLWTPSDRSTFRAAISRSLGGAGFDQSFQLEPTQVAGFNQAFRSLIPESVANANSGAEFRMAGVGWDQRVASNTWAGLGLSFYQSDVERVIGAFDIGNPLVNRSAREAIEYQEQNLTAYVHQLLGDDWSFGLRYRLSHADIELKHLDIPASAFATGGIPTPDSNALLHHGSLYAQFQHPGGFFSRGEISWRRQDNHDYTPALADEDFWHFDVYVGYRWPKRRVEVLLGLLNITDQDYRLNSLNLMETLPRERTFVATLRFRF